MFWRNKEIKESEPVVKNEVPTIEMEDKYTWINGYVLLDSSPKKYDVGNTYGEEEITFTVFENLESMFYRINDLYILGRKEIYKAKGYKKDTSCIPCFYTNPFSNYQHYATKITIEKELKWKDLKAIIARFFPMVETKDEYEQAKEVGYTEFAKKKFSDKAIKLGHSETFATVVFPNQRGKDKDIYDKMIALNEEGL